MPFFYQDISSVLGSILLLLFLVGEMIHFRRLPKGGPLLLGLILFLSTAGLSDLIFRSNPNPTIILFADGLNVFCSTFALAIIFNYSLVYFSRSAFWAESKYYLFIVVAYGASLDIFSVFLNLGAISKIKSPSEKNQSILLVCVLILLAYFYNSSLILPFLFQSVNFASPLPTTFAILLLVYGYIAYNYFSLEQVEEKATTN